MAKSLKELVALLASADVKGELDRTIEKITCDSRQVIPGSLFICLTGAKVDGHDYIAQACQAGAVAVLAEKEVAVEAGVSVIRVPSTRAAMQVVGPYFFDYPARKMRLIGVTGTNGKTTTTYLIRHILQQAGFKVGLIGTIQTMIGERILPVKNTTPDVVDLQGILADMAASGMDYAVMEVSSHALSLGRVSGCEFDTAVFTNMTQDHLDFHITFEHYAAAKSLLFQSLDQGAVKEGKTAVINIDDPSSGVMLRAAHCRTIRYAVKQPADLRAQEVEVRDDGARFRLTGEFGDWPFHLKITGVFNIYNVMAAVGATLAEGVDLPVIRLAVESFQSVPGRFELVKAGQPFTVIVDYAHTPDGLENILRTAQQFAEKKMIVVFGCGGDRDKTKRPIMGRLAAQYADVIIATSDNPRTEDPETILQEIEIGIREGLTAGKQYESIVNRRDAIHRALHLAQDGDIVIIAGKGHETYQILKDRTISFDDREVVREIIKEMK
ncbi:folylpolyglutamate synthase signature 1 [Lucifera butyrica]|uniref:UDP-N-acetylmuramoyl-L-alanyl-D-glutamate--2,6-diaminopimelate ligase n=1 Tax=Lucifera butyrica TaxID=1351585 RepID=A0A498R472_9FIRM|nr:UDP-N-acetylmuramoyl-L-alanyl-D-glutamate--2,6-diaminopimelate ligase [Lucifera butyrica]VBB06224.1 folylpolyglutamate synthase signature 1 [Lucifera butyrica]